MLVVGTPGFQDGVQIPVASLLDGNLCLQDSAFSYLQPAASQALELGVKSLLNVSDLHQFVFTWEHNCLVFNFQVFLVHLVFGEASQKLARFHINKN